MTISIRKQEAALQGLLESGWIKPDMLDAIRTAAKRAGDLEAHAGIRDRHRHHSARIPACPRRTGHGHQGRQTDRPALVRTPLAQGARAPAAAVHHQGAGPGTRRRMFPSTLPGWSASSLRARKQGPDNSRFWTRPRRLALESHRQAHCIVSYAERFRCGALGGVSVLTGDGQRWTVTIKPPADRGQAVDSPDIWSPEQGRPIGRPDARFWTSSGPASPTRRTSPSGISVDRPLFVFVEFRASRSRAFFVASCDEPTPGERGPSRDGACFRSGDSGQPGRAGRTLQTPLRTCVARRDACRPIRNTPWDSPSSSRTTTPDAVPLGEAVGPADPP